MFAFEPHGRLVETIINEITLPESVKIARIDNIPRNCMILKFGYHVKWQPRSGFPVGQLSFNFSALTKRIVIPVYNDNFVTLTNKPFFPYGRKREWIPFNAPNFNGQTLAAFETYGNPNKTPLILKLYFLVLYNESKSRAGVYSQ